LIFFFPFRSVREAFLFYLFGSPSRVFWTVSPQARRWRRNVCSRGGGALSVVAGFIPIRGDRRSGFISAKSLITLGLQLALQVTQSSWREECCLEHKINKHHTLGYLIAYAQITLYIAFMLPLPSLGEQIATKRKALGLTQAMLARKARVGLSTLDALENGRLGELGYSKITNILTALGLELRLQEASAGRPTLDELMEEGRDDQGLDRRR
jgi:Helix-turn-helix domain